MVIPCNNQYENNIETHMYDYRQGGVLCCGLSWQLWKR